MMKSKVSLISTRSKKQLEKLIVDIKKISTSRPVAKIYAFDIFCGSGWLIWMKSDCFDYIFKEYEYFCTQKFLEFTPPHSLAS